MTDGEAEGIVLRNLELRVGEHTLLQGANATFPSGGVTLVVGASGAGKSLLLKLLAGLLDQEDLPVDISGSVSVDGVEILPRAAGYRRGRTPSRGIIFQNFALFDELSAEENVRFAHDHRSRNGTSSATPQALLEELGVPRGTPVSALSGGEKQRLAIARTLAFDPQVILYDEPTSGLDAANAARVSRRIRATADAHKKTTIVVTHDYEVLPAIADAVFLLNPVSRKLEQVPAEAVATLPERLVSLQPQRRLEERVRRRGARAATAMLSFLEGSGRVLEGCLATTLGLLPLWRSLRWGLRYLRHYLWVVASPSAWLYFGSAGVIAGFVSTHFVFKFLPHRKYTEPLLTDEILQGLGFALYRILVPVLLTVLLAARCGAAVASDVGNRLYGHQIDAMRSLGVRPARYLLTNILLAFLAATPLLIGIGFLTARYTSLAVFTYGFPEHGANYWDVHFHRNLIVPGHFAYRGTLWLLAKILACGIGVGGIAYHVGMRQKSSGVEVSRDITVTIIIATLYVLLVHFGFAFFEF